MNNGLSPVIHLIITCRRPPYVNFVMDFVDFPPWSCLWWKSTMDLFRSTDGGDSFQPQTSIWQNSPRQWLQGGSTSLLQLRSGRLLLPFHGGAGHQASQHNVVYCGYNDDDGQTWSRSNQPLDLPMRGPMEASVAELPDGELAMSLRTQSGTVFLSRSMDGKRLGSIPFHQRSLNRRADLSSFD